MKFSLLIILFFLISCTTNNTNLKNIKTFNSTGFAYIYNEQINENNIIISKKVNNELLQIFHKDLRVGTLIKLINPKTKDTLVLINSKKIQYPDFYKIMITKPVAKRLNLDNQLPLIEVIVLKKNKSFIAKKAKIFNEEKKNFF